MWLSGIIFLWYILIWSTHWTVVRLSLPGENCAVVPEHKLICKEIIDSSLLEEHIPESTKLISFTSNTLRCGCALKSLLEWKEANFRSLRIEGGCFWPEFLSGKLIEQLESTDIPCGVESSQEVLTRNRREVQENVNETQEAGNKTAAPGAPVLPCNFEEGFCQWLHLSDGDFEWTRHQGSTPSLSTGPSVDRTTGTTSGFYVFIETSLPRRYGETARLVSPTLAPVEPNNTCKMDLYIHMNGAHIGELNIYEAPVVGFAEKKFSRSTAQGENWFYQQVEFDSDTDFQVIIEGVRGIQHEGDIAIDDVSFTSGCKRLVPSFVRLTNGQAFNRGQVEVYHQGVWGPVCQEGWSRQDSVVACAELGFENVTATGGFAVGGAFSGFSAVHCSSNETSISQCQSSPWSNNITCTNGTTATLNCSGILSVCPRETHLYCPADHQGLRKCISRAQLCDFRNNCWDGSDETNCVNYTRCDFEDPGLCGWLQVQNEQIDWTRHRNNTPSYFTGPSADHNGDGNRYYLYMEVSGRRGGEKAKILVNPRFRGDSNGLCKVRFYYHMSGFSVGSLRVLAADRFTQKTLWQKSRSQGDAWGRAEVPLANFSTSFVVIFEGEHGRLGLYGDIAIDDVSFTPECRPASQENVTCGESAFQCGTGECIPLDRQCDYFEDCYDSSDELNCGVRSPGRCDFESDFCHWRNVTGDDFDWQRRSGPTLSPNTGPFYDHTRGFSGGGHYIYIEASSPRRYGDVARLISPQFSWKDLSNCSLRFFYHMWGLSHTLGSLRVRLQNSITGVVSNPLWQISGYQGNQWHRATVPIATSWPVSQVVIEATRGSTFMSDIAIDDISFSPQCFPSEDVFIYKNYDVRLVGGKRESYQGRVEVYRVGTWGTICDDAWDLNDAHVVCNQLGYGGALDVRLGSHFGGGRDQIWLDNLACFGNETNLSECEHNGWGNHNCDHTKDAGVICNKEGGTTKAVRLVGNSTHAGRVEIYHQGAWEPICYDGWDTHDAFVACRQLGFSGAESIMSDTTINPRRWLSRARCQGTESSLGACPHGDFIGGSCSYGYAAIVCTALGTAEGNIRLRGGSSPNEGRVEIFHRGEWGSICEDGWSNENARVVCHELGFTSVRNSHQSFGPGNGRVWLGRVQCTGSESALAYCSHSGWGVTSCPHDREVGVICSDDAYVGCYNDTQDHVMTHELSSTVMTPVKCLRRCQTKGYQYAGLEWASECYCGNHYDRYGTVPESDCNLPCLGDTSKICGGAWALSVYNSDPAIIPTSIPGYSAVTQSCRTRLLGLVDLRHSTRYYSGDHVRGWISSPNFPRPYDISTTCVWSLNLLAGTKAKIHFEFFLIEEDYDKLEIRDGLRSSSHKLTPWGGFTGNQSRDIMASSNVMWIQFVSDESITEKGFNLTYTAFGVPSPSPSTSPSEPPQPQKVEGGCNGQLDPVNRTFGYFDPRHSSGYVQSPGYPSNYANKLYCKWSIRVTAPYRVQVTVEHADISHAAQTGGLGDILRIDDGSNTMSSQDNVVPWSFLSSGHLVRVVFITDDRFTGKGFFLRFSRVIRLVDTGSTAPPEIPTGTKRRVALVKGLSGGTVAGIVVPILLLFIIAVIILFLLKQKKKRHNQGVRHGFVNEAYDNLEGMNMSQTTNTAQPQAETTNHNHPRTQAPSEKERMEYLSAAPPPYSQTIPAGIYFVPLASPAGGAVAPVGLDPSYASLYPAPPAYEAMVRPLANATTTTGIGSVTSLREAARDDGNTGVPPLAAGFTPLPRNGVLPPIGGTDQALQPGMQQPLQREDAGPLPEKIPMTVLTSPEPSAPPRTPSVASQNITVSPADQLFDMEVPFEFLCPISNKIMEFPMTASDGYNYERKAIRKWFRRKQTSPMTNEPLSDLNLRPNEELRQRIEKFMGEHSSV